jgi:hypothetical protein
MIAHRRRRVLGRPNVGITQSTVYWRENLSRLRSVRVRSQRLSPLLAPVAVALVVGVVGSCNLAGAAGIPRPNRKAGVASTAYLWRNSHKLVAIGAGWGYDWSSRLRSANLGIQWVPMVWSAKYLTPQVIQNLKLAKADLGVRYLLGFNEPDNRRQAKMSPYLAAKLWPELERTGLILGSPATETLGSSWLTRFMYLAHRHHLRVNFLALHDYPDFTNPDAVAEMRAQLIKVHDTYHLPIWITELGAIDIRRWGQPMMHPPTVVAAQLFMRQAFRMLNALPFVQRYAWYSDICVGSSSCRYSSLYTRSGALTPEGREFRRDA